MATAMPIASYEPRSLGEARLGTLTSTGWNHGVQRKGMEISFFFRTGDYGSATWVQFFCNMTQIKISTRFWSFLWRGPSLQPILPPKKTQKTTSLQPILPEKTKTVKTWLWMILEEFRLLVSGIWISFSANSMDSETMARRDGSDQLKALKSVFFGSGRGVSEMDAGHIPPGFGQIFCWKRPRIPGGPVTRAGTQKEKPRTDCWIIQKYQNVM